MLRAFEVGGFQSYREPQRIELHERMTFVAGRNDVGKSALLRALRTFVEPQEGAASDARFVFTIELPTSRVIEMMPARQPGLEGDPYASHRALLSGPDAHIIEAEFVTNGSPRIEVGQLLPIRLEVPRAGLRATGQAGQTLGWHEHFEGAVLVDHFLNLVRAEMASVTFITPRQVAQGARPLAPTPELRPNAGNLAEVLLFLQLNEPTGVFVDLVDFMRDAFPEIRTLTVSQDVNQMGGQMFGEPRVIYRHSDDRIPLRDCGSGVEQMLALAVALFTAPGPRLVLVDEPQAYLHPHAERSLLGLLEERREHQYIVATHSHQLLASRPLSQSRLLSIEGGSTSIVAPSEPGALLDNLGVTAADLWLNDRILWVEGPTEEVVFEVMLGDEAHRGIEVRRMPQGASRLAGRSDRKTALLYEFCEDVSEAVAALPVAMLFLFDRDEKTPELTSGIENASRGRARFLPVRETENLFLDVDLLMPILAERCADLGRTAPTRDALSERLGALLADSGSAKLFPGGLAEGASARDTVKGSEVLRTLFWDYLTSDYDKVRDGEALAARALADNPALLRPLIEVVRELSGDADWHPATPPRGETHIQHAGDPPPPGAR